MTSDERAQRRVRAQARRERIRAYLVRREADRPPVGETVEERLAMLADMSQRAWRLSGRPMPTYTRAEMPGRVIRKHDA